ncbi:hypothetical protein SAMN04487785_114136 [Dyella jiangningensis]|nr:hypothetical protein BDW41_11338 [Dyella sp. AtDHG13]SDL08561.1 hypothetical protein SAMN04487785_114136 [Dyella jiangningensis]
MQGHGAHRNSTYRLAETHSTPTVPSRFDTVYPALVKAAGHASNLTVLPPVGEGHCNFTPQQVGKAFDVLVVKADAH